MVRAPALDPFLLIQISLQIWRTEAVVVVSHGRLLLGVGRELAMGSHLDAGQRRLNGLHERLGAVAELLRDLGDGHARIQREFQASLAVTAERAAEVDAAANELFVSNRCANADGTGLCVLHTPPHRLASLRGHLLESPPQTQQPLTECCNVGRQMHRSGGFGSGLARGEGGGLSDVGRTVSAASSSIAAKAMQLAAEAPQPEEVVVVLPTAEAKPEPEPGLASET